MEEREEPRDEKPLGQGGVALAVLELTVDQAGLQLTEICLSLPLLGLKACTTPSLALF